MASRFAGTAASGAKRTFDERSTSLSAMKTHRAPFALLTIAVLLSESCQWDVP